MERDYYDILGEQAVREMSVGFDWGGAISAAANVAKTGVEQKQAHDAADKSKRDSDTAVAKSLTADAAWANAEANLELAQGDATSSAAARVMQASARHDADAAAAALQGDGIGKRCKAAQDNLKTMTDAASAAPKDIAKQAKMHAWQKVVASCGPAPAEGGGESGGGKATDGSFLSLLTAKRAGLPVYLWVGGGVATLTVVLLIARGMMNKKR